MRKKVLLAVLVFVRFLATPATSIAADPISLATPAIAIDAVLKTDRTEYHPGEVVRVVGSLKNAGSVELKLPSNSLIWPFAFAALHIHTPNGDDCTYDPYGGNPLRSSFAAITPRGYATKLPAGDDHLLFQKELRLTRDLIAWSDNGRPVDKLSLRLPGRYQIWFEYRVPPVAGAPTDAWTGVAKSNTIEFTVADLLPARQLTALTAEQRATIEKIQHAPPTSTDGLDFLGQQMLLAENEPLAARLVELCLADPPRNMDFIRLVWLRACSTDFEKGANGPLLLGIDGPYLKTAGLAAIDAIEQTKPQEPHRQAFRSSYGIDLAIAYLRFHADDADSRERLVKIAKQSAPIPSPHGFDKRPATGPISTPEAWTVLTELGVLHAGMTIDEAIAILGQPSGRSDKSLTWYLESPRHVNPGLSAKFENGRIVAFSRYSG
jgi:hypothetical protein